MSYIVVYLFLALYNVNCSQVCENTPGSYKCGCQTGYLLDLDGTTCTPQVECSGTTVCGHSCVRLDGQDTCTCNPGYQLDSDNSTCIDLDECATGTSTCDAARGVCTNTDGSFTCACNDGYNLGPNNECDGKLVFGRRPGMRGAGCFNLK